MSDTLEPVVGDTIPSDVAVHSSPAAAAWGSAVLADCMQRGESILLGSTLSSPSKMLPACCLLAVAEALAGLLGSTCAKKCPSHLVGQAA